MKKLRILALVLFSLIAFLTFGCVSTAVKDKPGRYAKPGEGVLISGPKSPVFNGDCRKGLISDFRGEYPSGAMAASLSKKKKRR